MNPATPAKHTAAWAATAAILSDGANMNKPYDASPATTATATGIPEASVIRTLGLPKPYLVHSESSPGSSRSSGSAASSVLIALVEAASLERAAAGTDMR